MKKPFYFKKDQKTGYEMLCWHNGNTQKKENSTLSSREMPRLLKTKKLIGIQKKPQTF